MSENIIPIEDPKYPVGKLGREDFYYLPHFFANCRPQGRRGPGKKDFSRN